MTRYSGTEFIHDPPGLDCDCDEPEFAAWAVEQYGAELGGLVPLAYRALVHPTPLCAGRDANHHRLHHHHPLQSGSVPPSPPRGPAPGVTSASWVAATRSAGDFTITCRARELLLQVRHCEPQRCRL